MRLSDLVASQDGSMSLTKLAAATGHLLFAIAFLRLQVLGDREFNAELWLVYGGFCIGHAAYDKTSQMVKSVREKRIEAQGTVNQEGAPP